MTALIIAFLTSALVSLLIIRYQHLHGHLSADIDTIGIQKFHSVPVPRIGGLAIIVGIAGALIYRASSTQTIPIFALALLASALPTFLMGFTEDVTKKIGARIRLAGAIASAALCGYLMGAWIDNIQVFGLDAILLWAPVSILFTCFCVAGVSNAFNIIDGYHGLSSVVALIILVSIAYVGLQVGDSQIIFCALIAIGSILGFLIWNYPRGLIFLGDGGAYLIGFWIAELSILLVLRNPQVSKWFPMLICFYPIFETIFTLYRRIFIRRVNPTMPDAAHLHQIIYKRIVRWAIGKNNINYMNQRNAMTAPYLWVLSSAASIPGIIFWNNHIALKIFFAGFALLYVWLYWSIVKFKTPFWLRHNGKNNSH
jgi:UDP-N-acetylmuramyl pentapeptide phosphotransferase/UDP-N-acetylglucosamine-1-phosphate transferase